MSQKPYNPLEKRHLAGSIARAILESDVRRLSETQGILGAGIYVIYYTGDVSWYEEISKLNKDGFTQPIYVGKAIPPGGRKGGFSEDASAGGTALRERLGQHYSSVNDAVNLNAEHFYFRCLPVDDVWIPLGENMLIEQFKPIWNRVIDGFGNKDPGNRRKEQFRSPWDVIHPGRKFAEKLGENPRTSDEIVSDLMEYFRTGKVPKRLKKAATKVEDPGKDEDSQVGLHFDESGDQS